MLMSSKQDRHSNSQNTEVALHALSFYSQRVEQILLMPQALCALLLIVVSIIDWPGCGTVLVMLFYALVYPLIVPAGSIYWAARELFWGEDRGENLTFMTGLKMYEHLG